MCSGLRLFTVTEHDKNSAKKYIGRYYFIFHYVFYYLQLRTALYLFRNCAVCGDKLVCVNRKNFQGFRF
jgi:hypothetical protein